MEGRGGAQIEEEGAKGQSNEWMELPVGGRGGNFPSPGIPLSFYPRKMVCRSKEPR